MKPIVKALAVASVCAILSMPAQADAQQITLSLSGVIDQGRDDLNLFFGDPGEVVFLSGQTYSMSLTVDAADLDLIHSTPTFADYSGASVALTGALTMNGKTLTWTTDMASSSVRLELEPDIASSGVRQGVSMRSTSSRQPGTATGISTHATRCSHFSGRCLQAPISIRKSPSLNLCATPWPHRTLRRPVRGRAGPGNLVRCEGNERHVDR